MSSIGSLASPSSVLPGLPAGPSSAPSSQRSVFERMLMHSVASSGFGDGFDASDFERFSSAPTAAPAPIIEAPRFTLRDSPSLASNHRWHPPAMFGNFPEALTVFDEPAYSSHAPQPSAPMDWSKPAPGPSLLSQFGGMLSSAWARFAGSETLKVHSDMPEAISDAEIAELQVRPSSSDDGFDLGDLVVNLASGHMALLNSKVRLQSGAALGLKLDEETYKAESPMVRNDPFRKASAEAWKSDGEKVVWSEVVGVAELGGGKNGTLTLGDASAGVGFSANGFIRYRTVQPVNVNPAHTVDNVSKSHAVGIPMQAESYVGMSPGTEFEVSGKGSVKLSASASVGKSVGGIRATLGASAGISAHGLKEQDVTLNVKVLDSDGIVRVSVQDSGKERAELSARLHAGLTVNGALPTEVGNGALRYLVEANALKPLTSTLNKMASAESRLSRSHESSDKELGTFTLNLKSRAGQEAFEALKNLDLDHAAVLASQNTSGVWKTALNQKVDVDALKGSLRLGSRQLWMHEQLRQDKSVSFSSSEGAEVNYEESVSKLKRRDFLTGDQGIQWSAVTSNQGDGKASESMYQLEYNANETYSPEGAVQRFLAFSRLLGVEYDGDPKTDEVKLSTLGRFFSSDDDAKVKVNLYVTEEGMERAAKADTRLARRAYHQASAELEPGGRGLEALSDREFQEAESLAQSYADAMRERGVPDSSGDFELIRAEGRYATLTGRNLGKDYRQLLNGQAFAEQIGALRSDASESERRHFFADLGSSTRFQFMPVMSAITMLAGEEEVLVDSLSMNAKGVSIQGVSEGRIAHPETEIKSLVSQVEKRALGASV